MRVLMVGGSGLIGRALAPRLVADGHSVVILTRRPDRLKELGEGVTQEAWDGRTTHGWGPLVDGDCAIVNLAGENLAAGRWTQSRKRRILESRVDATRAVTEAILKARTKPVVLLQASAVGYYGPRGGAVEDGAVNEGAVDEGAGVGDGFLARVCVDWEKASEPVEAAGVRRVILRTGVVLAQDGGALSKMALPFRWFLGGPMGSGRQAVPWIHIEDVVASIIFLLASPDAAGPFNLSAPEAVDNRRFSSALGKALGRPSFLPAPAFALCLVLGEMADMLLTGQNAVPRRLQESGYRFHFSRLDAALEDLLS